MLYDVEVPLYDSGGQNKKQMLIVNESAGRIVFSIRMRTENLFPPSNNVCIECCFEDLERAWRAVRP